MSVSQYPFPSPASDESSNEETLGELWSEIVIDSEETNEPSQPAWSTEEELEAERAGSGVTPPEMQEA